MFKRWHVYFVTYRRDDRIGRVLSRHKGPVVTEEEIRIIEKGTEGVMGGTGDVLVTNMTLLSKSWRKPVFIQEEE